MTVRRGSPWLGQVSFHKEVTRRGEETSFALSAKLPDSDRWTSLAEFELVCSPGHGVSTRAAPCVGCRRRCA